MMIVHNMLAMNTQRQLGINTKQKSKSTERLSSGYRINRAADDAAGLAISEKMRRMIRGLNQGAENTMDGISFMQVGDGAMNEIHDIVHRMTELAVQASNGTMTEEDRSYIDEEVQALKQELNKVAQGTTFNEIPIFNNNTAIFGLEGTPNDLEIFNASYDNNGNLVTYGGFVFHGERITWDMIDAGMVETDPDTNKEVFVGGEYSFTSANTGYSFDLIAKDGNELPIITREISVDADMNGVILNKEHFDWSQIYDLNGTSVDPANLHAGPFAVDFYGSKFVFTVSEPIIDLNEFVNDIQACKSSTVYYNWEVYYSQGGLEKAVDVYNPQVVNKKVTQTMVDNMLNEEQSSLKLIVKADENGVWLSNSDGNILSGSEKTWADLGIASWDEGMVVPNYNNGTEVAYTYEEPSTGLKYQFSLSDITSKDSVIDGLDGMVIKGTPGSVSYNPSISVNGEPNVLGATCHKTYFNVTFKEELAEGRRFDEMNWSTSTTDFRYEDQNDSLLANDKIEVSFDGGMVLSGSVTVPNTDMKKVITDYLNWLESAKKQALLAGNSGDSVTFDDYSGKVQDKIFLQLKKSGVQIELNYDYDYREVLRNFTDNVKIDLVQVNSSQISDDLYIKKPDNTYISAVDYRDSLFAAIDADDSLSDNEKATEKVAKVTEIENMQKYEVTTAYMGYDDATQYTTKADMAETAFPVIWGEVIGASELSITSDDYSKVNVTGNELNNYASRPEYVAVMKETPMEPDLYIVHSAEQGDETGIPRFAMKTTALGIAFAECKTKDGAYNLLNATKNALNYVSSKRSIYGGLQNRLEHTYNNNQNVSENLTASESLIRDADMADLMVQYSNENILEQVGQAMLAQANQSNQGVLTLINQ